ncbi:MAG: HEPN domain-containing protein [Rikenellaceae bacterium]|nr:HEPN domain-containing protein [Rikenellaceae bacterium]
MLDPSQPQGVTISFGEPQSEPLQSGVPDRAEDLESIGATGQASICAQPALELLYNPAEAARITNVLREGFAPEYILLFGSLAGGTPHSDVTAYDLLLVVREQPSYGWPSVKRYLKYKLPFKRRNIPYVNIYIHTLGFIQSHPVPFLWLAQAEGDLLYCNDRYNFRRPRKSCDFRQAYCDANFRLDTFLDLGDRFLGQADGALTENDIRVAAFCTAQAAVLFYHVLFFVFHGFDTDTHDMVLMHDRLRTLSGELMLLLDSDSSHYNDTLPCLNQFLIKARYEPDFTVNPRELEQHIDRVTQMREIVGKVCKQRIALYKDRAAQD